MGSFLNVYQNEKTSFRGFVTAAFEQIAFLDIGTSVVKATVFGLIISLIGSYQGLTSEGGAEGVGYSTTRAVVWSAVLIFVSDYIVATLLFSI